MTKIVFSLCFRQFTGLDKSDQRQLLSRNTPILVQVLMGCYLLAEGSHIPHESKMNRRLNKKVWMNNFMQKLHLEKFNSITNLFCPDVDLDQYARLINKLKGLPALVSIEQKAILSFIILFGNNQQMPATQEKDGVRGVYVVIQYTAYPPPIFSFIESINKGKI